MDIELKIARAIKTAHQLYENSWNDDKEEYMLNWEKCWQDACKKCKLSNQIWYVLYLANHWYNDLALWATEVDAGRRTFI